MTTDFWAPSEAHHWQLQDGQERDRLQIAATLDLSRLIFSDHELNALRLFDRRIETRRLLLEEVTDLFVQWQATFESDCFANERIKADRASLEAHLDSLTGGWLEPRISRVGGQDDQEVAR
jgi:hypothetical protein